MARVRWKYNNSGKDGHGQSRGGVPGKAVDTSFGAPGNKNKSPKRYGRKPVVSDETE